MIHVALKEGREETGLKGLELLNESILAIDVLLVSPHVRRDTSVSSHVHLNVTYLCQAGEWDTLCSKPGENSGVRWIVVEEIDHYVTEEDMKLIYQKLVERSRNLLLAD